MGHIYTKKLFAFLNFIKLIKKINQDDTSCHPSKSLSSEIFDMHSCTTAECSPADCPLFLNLENLRGRI